ncbi:MAG: nitroreductase family protein [Kofleriaceae bacterium]
MTATALDPQATLAWLQTRRSTRTFTAEPVPRAVLERLLEAAITAPSNSNRQPWKYVIVESPALRRQLVERVRAAAEALAAQLARGPHAEEFGGYGDFFWQPLAAAAVLVLPCVRRLPDTLGALLRSAGVEPGALQLPGDMPMEVCATSAGVMAMMLQAHAEGLGACWMAGPMIAARELEQLCAIREPELPASEGFHLLGALALGYPDDAARAAAKPPRRPLALHARFL